MYSKAETPIFRASMCYYDNLYEEAFAQKVLSVLEKYQFFPPEKINAENLTRNRFIKYHPENKGIFTMAYAKKDILGLNMASGNSAKTDDYWSFIWNYTFYKNSKLPVIPRFKPWNVILLGVTHKRMAKTDSQECFIKCIKDLIHITHPFFVKIDDVDHAVNLLANAKKECFSPDDKPPIYWGNYWGNQFARNNHLSIAAISDLPSFQTIDDGFFFTLSDDIFDFESKETNRTRKKIEERIEYKGDYSPFLPEIKNAVNKAGDGSLFPPGTTIESN